MKLIAEICFGWLVGSGALLLALALYEAWRTPSRGTRIWKEVIG